MTGIAGEILKMVQGDGVAKLTGDLGLDGGTASSAVQATVETVLGQLGGAGSEGLSGLLGGKGLGALGGLLGGSSPLPDHGGAVSALAGRLGLGKAEAGGILDALLPMILNAVKKLGSSGGGVGGALGGIGKLLG